MSRCYNRWAVRSPKAELVEDQLEKLVFDGLAWRNCYDPLLKNVRRRFGPPAYACRGRRSHPIAQFVDKFVWDAVNSIEAAS